MSLSVDDSNNMPAQQALLEYAHSGHHSILSNRASRPISTISASPGSSMCHSSTALDTSIDSDRLPDYVTALGRPTLPTTYKFVPSDSPSAMIVTQYSDESEAGAKFHISVGMNCFMPLNHVTTIRRGSSPTGELVAEFEMGISEDPAMIIVGSEEITVSSVLSKLQGSRHSAMWLWSGCPSTSGLLWDTRKMPFLCISMRKIGGGVDSSTVATFTPARRGNPPAAVPELTVTPLGQDYFDEIILSLLIIERKRLTPGKSGVLKQLFN
ncbi:hypothetical protein HYPSUDRAFT_62318 [Hypholoma sublateritium FD-334 SS-4]|uniref:DUF6593 domain-containing protein n=1 Tax=Hypholoma sublateritium (strain FD-334 SS-4) TaxID=945553 RepID=A0A0D2Q857_HYPSF|nr:hypothetical protein HYPSUDRAFT_62318 [Hypholoma sublateritium FD-334 SS-4]